MTMSYVRKVKHATDKSSVQPATTPSTSYRIFFAIMLAPSTTKMMESNFRNFLEEYHMTAEGKVMMKDLVHISFSNFIPGFKVF